MNCTLRTATLALLGLALVFGCTGDDDDGDPAPAAALASQTDWAHGANPGLNEQPRGRLNWFPRQATLTQQQIHPGWPHNEEVTLLELVHQPFAFLAGSTTHYVPDSWTSLSSRLPLDTLGIVLELKRLFASLPDAGVLVIDIGEFSEDENGNGMLESEDGNADDVLQAEEDLGLDGGIGPDVPWPLPVELVAWTGSYAEQIAQFGTVYDWIDSDGDNTRNANEAWSMDDWSRADESNPLGVNPCGMEGNNEDPDYNSDYNFPDSEDLDGDGVLDTADNYRRYTLPLDPAAPTQDAAITQLTNSDWLQLSLQLERAHTTVGTPNPAGPQRVRLSLTGFNGPAILYLTWFDWR